MVKSKAFEKKFVMPRAKAILRNGLNARELMLYLPKDLIVGENVRSIGAQIEKLFERYGVPIYVKIKIWPKDYDKLPECGFKFGKGVMEYYKKHELPVVLYPPALSRTERKRLKEAMEDFKRRNGIE